VYVATLRRNLNTSPGEETPRWWHIESQFCGVPETVAQLQLKRNAISKGVKMLCFTVEAESAILLLFAILWAAETRWKSSFDSSFGS
jgi:hypothetical protein